MSVNPNRVDLVEDFDEVDLEAWIVSCDECEKAWEIGHRSDAHMFWSNHRKHTGHKSATEPMRAVDYIDENEYVVQCKTCDEEWSFDTEDDAEQFFDEHSLHSGHEADDIVAR